MRVIRALASIVTLAVISNPIVAADSVGDPALQKEAADWKAKADIETSKKSIQDAKYPKPNVTPLAGGIKADNSALIENKILAYCSLRAVTDKIAQDIQTNAGGFGKLILMSGSDATWLQQYRAMMYELTNIKAEYEALGKDVDDSKAVIEKFLPAIAPVVSVLGGIADLLALFRTNETLTGSSFDVDDMALVNSLSISLRALTPPKDLVWASSLGFGVGSSENLKSSKFANAVSEISRMKADIDKKIQKMADEEKAAAPKPKPKAQAKGKPADAADQKADGPSAKFKARLNALNDRFDALIAQTRGADGKGAQIPLVSLLSAERIGTMIEGGKTGLMAVKVVALGGNNMTTQNLFFGDHLYQSGGAIVAYQVFNKSGDIVWNNNIPSSTGYVEFKRNDEIGRADKTGFDAFCK